MSAKLKITISGDNADHASLMGLIIAGMAHELSEINEISLVDKGTTVDFVPIITSENEADVKKMDERLDSMMTDTGFEIIVEP
jgi:hypothetical protein